MSKISTKFDKSTAFGAAMLLTGQQAISQQTRSTTLSRKDQMSKEEKIFEAVTMSLSTIGSTLTSAGMTGGPKTNDCRNGYNGYNWYNRYDKRYILHVFRTGEASRSCY